MTLHIFRRTGDSIVRAAFPLLIIVLIASCAHAPLPSLTNGEVIHIQLNTTQLSDSKTKEEFITAVTKDLANWTSDELSKAKAVEIAAALYPEYSQDAAGRSTKYGNIEAIKTAFYYTFLGLHHGETSRLETARNLGFANSISTIYNLENASIKETSRGIGSGAYDITLLRDKVADNNTPLIRIHFDLSYRADRDMINVDISNVSYAARNFTLEKAYLLKIVNGITLPPVPKPNMLYYSNQVAIRLERRYDSQTAYANKNSNIFKVDFATAKARLQRALGDFKYDSQKSTFSISRKYRNPVKAEEVTHRFLISLFPDKNNTVVEISGDYGFYNDTFGGPTLFGADEYDAEQKVYIQTIKRILSI